MMSSYRPGMNLSPTASKKPTPSKSKKKSSGGGDFDAAALLKDKRVLGGLGAVLLIVGIYFGIGLLPEGTGALVKAHKDLTAILKELEGKADSMPTEKKEVDAIKAKTKKAVAPLAKLKSKNPAKSPLTQAKSKLDLALSKKKPEEVKTALEDAKKKLDDAKKKLKI